MWAFQLVRPGLFEEIEAPAPDPAELEPGNVVLRTLAAGICGSDIPKLTGRTGARADELGRLRPARPGFPLHEVVGEVVASRHQGVPVGSRVVGWANRGDGLAEFVVTDGDQVFPYDSGLTPEEAVLIQPLACVLEALGRVPVTGKVVTILGLGPIGLLFAHGAKARGASRVIGIDPVDRAHVAAKFMIDDLVVSPSTTWARAVADPHRGDVVVEAVGHQVSTLNDAIAGIAAGGTLLYFGIPDDEYYPIDMESMVRKNLTLIAGTTRNRRAALADADSYLCRYPELDDAIVSHRFDRRSVQQAFTVAATTTSERLKVVLTLA